MKKKLLLITGLLVLAATAVFGRDSETVWTSSGRMAIINSDYKGKYKGQTLADGPGHEIYGSTKPSGAFLELVKRTLNGYDTAEGDTFEILIVLDADMSIYLQKWGLFYCEYTSATEYNYWFFFFQVQVPIIGE
jgi:hypothetical protein